MTKIELLRFLRKHRLGVLTTVSNQASPESALVGIAVTDQLELVFDTLESTKKCQNLRKNPKIALVIGWGDDETTLQLEGIADEPKGAELERIREIYFSVYPDGRERLSWSGITHFRVRPTWARFSDFKALPEPRVVELSEKELTTPIMKIITMDHLDITSHPVTGKKGERVTLIKHDSRPEWKGWFQCSFENGRLGWISESYLDINGNMGVFNKDYDAREIEVKVGEMIEILREDNGWSWIRKSNGSEGWIPSQCH